MMFEETASSGTETTYHLHHDSDEVPDVPTGEIIFRIGEEVTVGGPGTCAFVRRGGWPADPRSHVPAQPPLRPRPTTNITGYMLSLLKSACPSPDASAARTDHLPTRPEANAAARGGLSSLHPNSRQIMQASSSGPTRRGLRMRSRRRTRCRPATEKAVVARW